MTPAYFHPNSIWEIFLPGLLFFLVQVLLVVLVCVLIIDRQQRK